MGESEGAGGASVVGCKSNGRGGGFLESMRVGCRTAARALGAREVEGQASGDEGEEGGPVPPWVVISLCSFPLPLLLRFLRPFLCPAGGEQEIGAP